MSEQNKIFAGPRIRRIRKARNLSQSAMALEMGISASYLNLIERNQRPLTVQLILKLAATYNIALEDLQGDADGTVTALKQVFNDSLLIGELPSYEELFEIADFAPNVASSIVKLHQSYRRVLDRLSSLNEEIADGSSADLTKTKNMPHLVVERAVAGRANYFDALERAAETIAAAIPQDFGLWSGLQIYLRDTHRIQVQTLPIARMPNQRSWYDKHSMRLFISDALSWPQRIEALATHIAFFALGDELEQAVLLLNLGEGDERALARFYMARYAALAIALPYGRFLRLSEQMSYDIEALAARFGLSFSQIGWRLTNLTRAGAEGPAFSVIQMDQNGHNIRRAGSQGFPQARFGGGCARLGLFSAARQRGGVAVEKVSLGQDQNWVTISKFCSDDLGAYNGVRRGYSFMLICDQETAANSVYAKALEGTQTLIGRNCRLCEVPHCTERYDAPITRPPALDESAISVSDFDFKA